MNMLGYHIVYESVDKISVIAHVVILNMQIVYIVVMIDYITNYAK